MAPIMTLKQNNTKTGSLHAVISVVMALLLMFLPLTSWSSSILSPLDEPSERPKIAGLSDLEDVSMPCHSSDSGLSHSKQSTQNLDCCNDSVTHFQCDNCEHNCSTFVKHFSNFIDTGTIQFCSSQMALKPIDHTATQYPVPPFRPPAA